MKPIVKGILMLRTEAMFAFFMLFMAIFIASCTDTAPPASKSGFVSDIPSLSDRIAELTPGGWEIFDRVKIFMAENLYKHIDGRAELYLAYDVRSLTTVTLENESDLGEFIELSIFDMKTPINAFGIFSVERAPDEVALDLGRISYSSDSSIFIWKGSHYITIVTSSSSEKIQRISLDLAPKVTALLTDSGEPVWGLSVLPQKNIVPDSEKYFKVDAFGLDFLPNTFTAKYRRNDIEMTVFLSKQNSPGAAQDSVERYSQYSIRYGSGSQRLKRDDIELLVCDMNGSFDVVFHAGRLVGGVQSVANRSTALEATVELYKSIDWE